jgi:hypothetical protein
VPRPKIQLAILGRLPLDIDVTDLVRWRSAVFEIDANVESFHLNEDAEGADWEYTDHQLEKYLVHKVEADFLLVFVNVKLEANWYVRRLRNNRVLFTFHEISEILRFHKIPLSNAALRVLYALSLVYRRYGNRIPPASERTNYAHDETRGCLFDMNAFKADLVQSCHRPTICEYCVAQLKSNHISNEVIDKVQAEIVHIQKPLFSRIEEFVRSHPIRSIAISLATALVIGVFASLTAAWIYDELRRPMRKHDLVLPTQ